MRHQIVRFAELCMAAAVLSGCHVQAAADMEEEVRAAGTEKEVQAAGTEKEVRAADTRETGQPDKSTGKKWTLGITLYSLQNEYTVRFANAAADYAEEKGIELQIYDGNYDAELQNNQVKQMIKDGADGLILNPQDAVKCSDCVDAAVEADVPIIAVNTRVENDGITSYVGSDDIKAGEMIMQKAAEILDGKGNVVILEGPLGQSAQLDRLQGIKNILKKYENIQIIGDKTANWSKLEAKTVMDGWLNTFDRIDAVVAENDDMALGAVQSIKEAAKVPGKDIQVISIDGSEAAMEAVREGSILMSVYQNAEEQARISIDILLKKLDGEPVEQEYLVPFEEVTLDNISDFIS